MREPIEPMTPQPSFPGDTAQIVSRVAYVPSYALMHVKLAIWAGSPIRLKLYTCTDGGGHGVWNDAGYDYSGSVPHVLHAASLLKVSMGPAP
jgi:hypothetical protein